MAALKINLRNERFEPLLVLEQWHQVRAEQGECPGAAECIFIGRMRPKASNGSPLVALELEHYPGMSEQQLLLLSSTCCNRHGVNSALVQHRIGKVLPHEAIVLIAICANQRGEAQRCCQELLEALKHEAPFWKREWRADGSAEWINGNTPF